jgi:NAD(P)-dependent dehydrogenase (short-subunit alcohol dehydrogenase family)
MALIEGKVAIITGAGGGVGRSHALLLAREGAAVVVNDYGGRADGTDAGMLPAAQSVADEIVAAGGRAVANSSDVSTVSGGKEILASALDAFGRADILVNNAGILRDKSLVKLEETDWDAVVAVHLKGAYCVTRPVFAWMKENGGGVIVNTTSTSALFGNPGQANYAAAKAGVWGFSNVLAAEGKRFGIRVWTLAPVAATRLTNQFLSDEQKKMWAPERLSPVVLYMVSDLSAPMTGRLVYASGVMIKELKLAASEGMAFGDGVSAAAIAAEASRIFLPEGSAMQSLG